MKILLYNKGAELFLNQNYSEKSNFEIQKISSMPKELSLEEVLVVALPKISLQSLNEFKYLNSDFIAFLTEPFDGYSDYLYNIGCIRILSNKTDSQYFFNILPNLVEYTKINQISSLLARNEWNMLKNIYRSMNGRKSILSLKMFGDSGESTFDVNLSRLRKKLQDPKLGNDFFRIVSKNGRVYLTSKIKNYLVNEMLFEPEFENDDFVLESLKKPIYRLPSNNIAS